MNNKQKVIKWKATTGNDAIKSCIPASFVLLLFFLFLTADILCETVCKLDINISGRHEDEVNEPGYTPWLTTTGPVASITVNAITFILYGTYNTNWYKAGVQSTYYARLANDGIFTGSGVALTIRGFPAGHHTLLTFHNTISNPANNTFPPMDIYVNDSLIYNNLIQTNRVTNNANTATACFCAGKLPA